MWRPLIALLALFAVIPCAPAASVGLPPQPRGVTSASTPAQVAQAVVAQRPDLVGGPASGDLVVAQQTSGAGGTTVVRLQQEIEGVPVLGGEVVVVVDRRRRVLAAHGEVRNGSDPPLAPTVSQDEARTIAIDALTKGLGPGLTASTPTLTVYDPASMNGSGPPRAVVAWDVQVHGGDLVRQRVFVDARTGIVIQAVNVVENAKSIAVCNALFANARVPCATPFTRIDSATPSGTAEVDNAYDLTGATYDFYAALGRDSIDGVGGRVRSTVNYCQASGVGCRYWNAFWNGTQMIFGQGFASADDVVAHELTHGVTASTSKLFYWYQSGAINEAISDIMGELFDLEHTPNPANPWMIGEESPLGIIRSMANPPDYGQPDTTTSALYQLAATDNGGVHTNSGVANKAAYLISEGGIFNGQTIAGIGLTKSKWLWYYTDIALQMSSDYADLAGTLDQTCAGLATLGDSIAPNITTADCTEVSKAITATEMRTSPVTIPEVCPTGATEVDAFHDGFDTGITTNWATSAIEGTNQWQASSDASPDGATMHWPNSNSTNARGVNTSLKSDSVMAMKQGVVVPSGAYLRVRHWHQFSWTTFPSRDFPWDGGVVEYQVGSAAWTDIGTLSPIVNPYTGTIEPLFGNPLAGRPGFVGASNGGVTTRVDLSSLAGQTVKFRFRLATDAGNSGYGWYIDDVRINSCAPGAPTVTGVTGTDGGLSVAFTLGATGGATPTNIAYSTDDGSTWTARSPVSTESPLVITGLANGDAYPVRLKVVGPGGTGAQSNAITESPNGPITRAISITSTPSSSYLLTDTPPTIVAVPSRAGGAVTYASSTTGVCTVNSASGVVTFVGTGTCSITATVALSGLLQPATSSAARFEVTAVPAPPPPPTPPSVPSPSTEQPPAAPAEVPAAAQMPAAPPASATNGTTASLCAGEIGAAAGICAARQKMAAAISACAKSPTAKRAACTKKASATGAIAIKKARCGALPAKKRAGCLAAASKSAKEVPEWVRGITPSAFTRPLVP